MTQTSATNLLIAMPGYSRLFGRAATYRVGMPEILRPAIGSVRFCSRSARNFAEAKSAAVGK